MTSAVVDESLYRFLESARNYLKFICDGILVHSTWRSDLVKVWRNSILPSFFFFQKFKLQFVLVVFSKVLVFVGGRLRIYAKLKLKSNIIYQRCQVCVCYADGVGPGVGDTISFLYGCPDLVPKTRIMTMSRLCCLCLNMGNQIRLKSNLDCRLMLVTDRIYHRQSSQCKFICFQLILIVIYLPTLLPSLNAWNCLRVWMKLLLNLVTIR